MTWSFYRWTWLLESPLFIGVSPAGSLNRCRLYVPARAMWGAVTAEIARAVAGSGFPKYDDVGKELQMHARFTYLFPAEQVGKRWCVWLPCYTAGKGLVWERGEGAGTTEWPSDREFRMRLLATRPSTAIDPASDTAADGSLRETECLSTHWRTADGQPGGPVGLVGYVFQHVDLNDEVRKALAQITRITVGGDARYGLGWLRRLGELEQTADVFGSNVARTNDDPVVEARRVLAHAVKAVKLNGAMELLRGWDYGKDQHWFTNDLLVGPGSTTNEGTRWRIADQGCWVLADGGGTG